MLSIFVFKQKTAYELRISDWSSDVCSSDLRRGLRPHRPRPVPAPPARRPRRGGGERGVHPRHRPHSRRPDRKGGAAALPARGNRADRSEEHTSELQSLMRISYAVFCLKNKKISHTTQQHHTTHTNNK